MKRVIITLTTLLLLNLIPLRSDASHIVATDLSLRCMGGNDYLVTFVMYRDCSGPGVPNSVTLNFSCPSSPGLTFTQPALLVPAVSGHIITPSCSMYPTQCNGGSLLGVDELVYQTLVTLTPCNSWRVSWTNCCRGVSNTIVNPTQTSLYLEATINNLAAPGISSPQFNNLPELIQYTGQTNVQTPGAIDIDGDSIAYSLVAPFNGNNTTFLSHLPPYSASQPLPSNPPVSINTANGLLSIAPTMNIIAPLAIKVEKWRVINGTPTLLGTVYRDMQVTSVNTNHEPPVLSGIDTTLVAGYSSTNVSYSISHCVGNPISFAVWGHDPDTFNPANSGDPEKIKLLWNSGIPNGSFIPYHQNTDSAYGVFSWNPSPADVSAVPHCFTVIVSDNSCPYNLFRQYTYCIYVNGDPVQLGPDTTICQGGTLPIVAIANTSNPVYLWKVNGIPTGLGSSTNQYHFHSSTQAPGNYTISVEVVDTVSPSNCPAFGQKTIQLLPSPAPYLGLDTTVGVSATVALDAGSGYSSYLWSTGDSTQQIVIDSTGTGAATATIWVKVQGSNGCEGSDTILVHFVHNPGMEESLMTPVIRISPNPNNGRFTLEFKDFSEKPSLIEIFGVDGKCVLRQMISPEEQDQSMHMDAGHLNHGIYLIKVSTPTSSLVRKMVINK